MAGQLAMARISWDKPRAIGPNATRVQSDAVKLH
jgi:hypothetical protein